MKVTRADYVVKQDAKGFKVFLKQKKKLKLVSSKNDLISSQEDAENFIKEDIFLINICMEPSW